MSFSTNGNRTAEARHQALVDQLKREGHIRSSRVEAAFRAIPRHLFLPGVPLSRVYSDEAIATKHLDGVAVSSSSQPAIMAIMLEQLGLQPGHRVLEIGAGTGYNAALMAHIVGETGQVITLDIDEEIVAAARQHLAAAGFGRVQAICGDGGFGYPDAAPYDRIILTVGAEDVVPAWREQLKPGGRLVLPLAIRGPQLSVAFQQTGQHLESLSVQGCGFMRLRGAFAESERTAVQLGPEPGLYLGYSSSHPVDAESLYAALSGASADWPTGVRVTAGELWSGFNLWLAARESGACDLSATGKMAERGVVPCLFTFGGEQKSYATSGLLGEGTLCVLARPPDHPSPREECDDRAPFPLFVRSFGPDDRLARHLVGQVVAWDAAGRPSTEGLRIRVYPREVDLPPPRGEVVVAKRWTQMLLDWPGR